MSALTSEVIWRAVMASEATKMAVGCNMGMDTRAIKATDIKSNVI